MTQFSLFSALAEGRGDIVEVVEWTTMGEMAGLNTDPRWTGDAFLGAGATRGDDRHGSRKYLERETCIRHEDGQNGRQSGVRSESHCQNDDGCESGTAHGTRSWDHREDDECHHYDDNAESTASPSSSTKDFSSSSLISSSSSSSSSSVEPRLDSEVHESKQILPLQHLQTQNGVMHLGPTVCDVSAATQMQTEAQVQPSMPAPARTRSQKHVRTFSSGSGSRFVGEVDNADIVHPVKIGKDDRSKADDSISTSSKAQNETQKQSQRLEKGKCFLVTPRLPLPPYQARRIPHPSIPPQCAFAPVNYAQPNHPLHVRSYAPSPMAPSSPRVSKQYVRRGQSSTSRSSPRYHAPPNTAPASPRLEQAQSSSTRRARESTARGDLVQGKGATSFAGADDHSRPASMSVPRPRVSGSVSTSGSGSGSVRNQTRDFGVAQNVAVARDEVVEVIIMTDGDDDDDEEDGMGERAARRHALRILLYLSTLLPLLSFLTALYTLFATVAIVLVGWPVAICWHSSSPSSRAARVKHSTYSNSKADSDDMEKQAAAAKTRSNTNTTTDTAVGSTSSTTAAAALTAPVTAPVTDTTRPSLLPTQLRTCLLPCLRLHLRLISSSYYNDIIPLSSRQPQTTDADNDVDAEDDTDDTIPTTAVSTPKLLTTLLLAPPWSLCIALAAWVAGGFWLFGMVLGEPTSPDGGGDDQEGGSVVGGSVSAGMGAGNGAGTGTAGSVRVGSASGTVGAGMGAEVDGRASGDHGTVVATRTGTGRSRDRDGRSAALTVRRGWERWLGACLI